MRGRDSLDLSLAWLNPAVRFLLELASIAWATGVPVQTPAKIALAVLAPVVFAVVWTLVVAPKADNRLSKSTRVVIGSGLLLAAAGGLAGAGEPQIAIVIAGADRDQHVVMLAGPGGDAVT